MYRGIRTFLVAAVLAVVAGSISSLNAHAAVINFNGQLDVILVDTGGALYSGVPVGTGFFGAIDDATANGFISDGTTLTPFGCCIAAGALDVVNDMVVDAALAALLNGLIGSSIFSVGDLVDIIDLEGDTTTASGGRIEIGLSYLFAGTTFSDSNLNNYPFDPNDLLGSLFFIAEFDAKGVEIYSAVGKLIPVPEPSTITLFAFGLVGLGFMARRRRRGAVA